MRTRCRLSALAVLVALAVPPAEIGALEPDRRRIRTRFGSDTTAVLLAVSGAQRKLQDPECRLLLTDFRDAEGRPLSDALAPLQMEPSDYITLLVFLDGGGLNGGALCRFSNVAAVTSPLSRAVYVCGASFRAQTAGLRENTLIHEMLHSLGLREAPPSSAEINRQVRRRCGM